jgi:hypothetical protein
VLKMSPTKIKSSDKSKEDPVIEFVQCGSSIRTIGLGGSGIKIRSRMIEYLAKKEQVLRLFQEGTSTLIVPRKNKYSD